MKTPGGILCASALLSLALGGIVSPAVASLTNRNGPPPLPSRAELALRYSPREEQEALQLLRLLSILQALEVDAELVNDPQPNCDNVPRFFQKPLDLLLESPPSLPNFADLQLQPMLNFPESANLWSATFPTTHAFNEFRFDSDFGSPFSRLDLDTPSAEIHHGVVIADRHIEKHPVLHCLFGVAYAAAMVKLVRRFESRRAIRLGRSVLPA